MQEKLRTAFDQLMEVGCDTRDIIEGAIEFTAALTVEELKEQGVVLDPDDAYDAIVDGIRCSSDRATMRWVAEQR